VILTKRIALLHGSDEIGAFEKRLLADIWQKFGGKMGIELGRIDKITKNNEHPD
jgi:hypothetical protein